MTLHELYDFALRHGCGELTPVIFEVNGTDHWCGETFLQTTTGGTTKTELHLCTSAENTHRNLQTLMALGRMKYESELVVLHESRALPVKSFARGATPDGGAKALILQT